MTKADRKKVTFRTVIAMSNAARAAKGQQKRAQERISNAVEMAQFEPIHDNPSVVATPEGYAGRFPISSIAAFAQREPPEWFVKGVLPKADLGVVFGAPGSGKSFFVLDLALSIARGIAWRDRRTRSGRVVYLAAEGAGGVALRLQAYANHNDTALGSASFGVMPSQPNFLVEDDVGEVARAIIAAGGADLVVVDTLAQVMPGANENGAEDIGRALANARMIRSATNAMVLLVHHSGKDQSKGPRGWSGLRAAADVEIEVSRLDDARWAKVTKLKDGEDGGEFHFALERVHLGVDRDGDEVCSAVVEPADPPASEEKAKPLGPTQKILVSAIEELQGLFNNPVELDQALARALDLKPHDPGPDPENPRRDQRRSNFTRTLEGLVAEGVVYQSGGRLSLQPFASNNDEGGVT